MSRSIMQDRKECYLCRKKIEDEGIIGRPRDIPLEEHHVMHGTANRKLAEHYGLKVWLCAEHHRTGKNAVHNCCETDLILIRAGQRRFEEIHSHEEWMSVFMKNYI